MSDYRDANMDIDARVNDLLDKMTLEEMILQTDQYSSGEFTDRDRTGGVSRTTAVNWGKLEKALGKKNFAKAADGLVAIRPGKPALVPATDKRPAWSPARAAFGAEPTNE